HTIDLEPHRSVLEGILQAKARFDGSIGIRCSCRAAICGSCGVRINGQPGLACHTHLDKARASSQDGTTIVVEPMGNMPIIKDLIVDMDAVHWKKVQRITPWLINKEPIPEREYIVPHENMVDVTQTMACIQCGACVSDCLSMEVDPLFVGPAALAKAYRFVGDPRDAQQEARLRDKFTPAKALRHPHRKEFKNLRGYFDKVEGRDQRLELNLYITGYDEDAEPPADDTQAAPEQGEPGRAPEESPSR